MKRVLAITGALALGVPAVAAAWIAHRTRELETRLGAVAGVPARIGAIDASLTGAVRLTDVALGRLVSARAIEASVSLESLLSGQLGADEIRVESPNVAIEVDATGDSDLARLVRRFAHPGRTATGPSRVRRIRVTSGTLSAHVAGIADLSADGVELVPDADGVRVITARVRVRAGAGRIHGELELQRAAAEVALPHVKFGRVLAVAGQATVNVDDKLLHLRDVAVGRLAPGGTLEARASLDDGGVSRELSASVGVASGELAIALSGQRVPLASFAGFAPHGALLDGARATGSLELHRRGDDLRVAIDGAIEGLRVDHKAIASQPVELAAALRATFAISPDAIALQTGTARLGAAALTASGWLRRGSPASGQLDVRLASAPCGDLMTSLPAELRGPLDGIGLTGTLGGRAHLGLDLAAPVGDGVELALDLDNQCEVTIEPPAADVTSLKGIADQVYPDGTRARIGHGVPGWTDLHRMPWHVSAAFMSAEDARFLEHHGFDLKQIARSFEIDLRDHRLARGGSTISQQLVKNAFLTQRRSLDRKIQEAILTWRLESRLDKKTILERYLNIIELGPHVFGIRAAAKFWFDESPRELTLHQAAFLAALTSEPQTMSRRVRHAGGLDPDSAARVDVILRAMRRDAAITNDDLDHARETTLHFTPSALKRD